MRQQGGVVEFCRVGIRYGRQAHQLGFLVTVSRRCDSSRRTHMLWRKHCCFAAIGVIVPMFFGDDAAVVLRVEQSC